MKGEPMKTEWKDFSKRYKQANELRGESKTLEFFACVDSDGKWFDSSDSFQTAVHWCRYYAGDFESTPDDITWMSENAPKLGYSVIHGSVLKKMWEKGLVS
jgi:hypothetical protein